ncbi:MAG TPA: DUF2231 domain-containing protein [Anaerolineales bacterium]|jgi:uncharacterized membrane protein
MDLIARIIHAITQLHPLHPMLVHFPIGLTGGGAFFMLLALLRKEKVLEQVAFANIALASVATLAAGAAGIYDNQLNYQGRAPNATAKIVLASVLLVITTLTALLRWRKPDLFENPSTRLLYASAYFVSFALALVLAFLGGVILYGF